MNDIGRARAESCLDGLREQIDQLDGAVIGLLADRSYLVGRLGLIKRALGRAAHQPEVQVARRERWRQMAAETGVDPDMAVGIFDVIHAASVAQQEAQQPMIGSQAGPAVSETVVELSDQIV